MSDKPQLVLIPVPLGEVDAATCLPVVNLEYINHINHYIVENIRSARRFLKSVCPDISIDSLTFYELNKHTRFEDISDFLSPLSEGKSVGVISEAGCPAIADPGADVVAIAQDKGYEVLPLVGPSSIILSLMTSGFNGQRFTFLGYLPIDEKARALAIKEAESRLYAKKETQIFIETPYRNVKLVEELIRNCKPSTKLCIACNLTCSDAYARTLPLAKWRNKIPDIHKKPAIFLLGL
ncbi:SAM-dependent methyltransferase [Porphyromonas pogonae]|uniref:SAM-dependent methyltransferase n=1 Tax=Porphyromonas pogonae TaxID=867595 RepID=UPI002E765D97|nr:SAM-dependent methyltransferase [Porphyromonas pogonae]